MMIPKPRPPSATGKYGREKFCKQNCFPTVLAYARMETGGVSIIKPGLRPTTSKHMKTSTSQTPAQIPFSRIAAESKDALAAMRGIESALEFEMEAERLEQVARELEWLGMEEGA